MSGDIQSRVYGWIDQQIMAAPGRAQLTGLRLAHLNAADQLQQIAHYPVSDRDESRIRDVKAEVFRTANEVAVQWSGFQRFAVQAFFGDEQSPGAYLPFSLSGQEQPASLSATEPPNMVGMVRQAMRHTEVMTKIAAGLMADGNANIMRQNQMLGEQLERTQAKYHQLLERTEAILAHADERAEARARLERSEKRKDEIAHRLLEALPIITNKISEKFGGPKLFAPNAGGAPPADKVLADMLASLSDETFDQMLACFPNPLHKAYVMELYKKLVLEPHKRAQAAAAITTTTNANGGKSDAH